VCVCVSLTCSRVGDPTVVVEAAVQGAGGHREPHEGVHTVLDGRDEDGPRVLGERQRRRQRERT